VTKLFSLTSSPPCSHPPLLLEHLASPPISLRPSWGKQRRRWSTSSSGGTRRSSSSAAPPLPLWILRRGDTWRGPHGRAAQRGEAAPRRDGGTTRQGGSATRGRCGRAPLPSPARCRSSISHRQRGSARARASATVLARRPGGAAVWQICVHDLELQP
jgi:hypothetical protein